MNLSLDIPLLKSYKNPSQIIRIRTEVWTMQNMYCPRCGYLHITKFSNNRPVADFYCERCGNEYELKSKNGTFSHKIPDGAYNTMISRITACNNPDFLLLSYSLKTLSVCNLTVIPKHFFTPAIIEKRNPLSITARRASWTGCNILLDSVPQQGRIPIISNGSAENIDHVVQRVNMANRLIVGNMDARGWLFDVLNCVNAIPRDVFSTDDIYHFEDMLSRLHPSNHNVKAKIRQQLQVLRDKSIIEFVGKGNYRKIEFQTGV